MSPPRDWVAQGCGLRQAMRGDRMLGLEEAADEAPVVRLGEGAPDTLPAPVLPDGGMALPGFRQDSPADLVGARVRLWIAGFLARHAHWDGVICAIDGEVSHWIHISADEAVSCQGFLTPRLVAMLGGATQVESAALEDSLSRPERLAAQLRSAEISGNDAALTGHLIGAELAAARPYWLGQQVAVIGAGALARAYAAALAAQGVPGGCHDPGEMTRAGLAALGRALGLAEG